MYKYKNKSKSIYICQCRNSNKIFDPFKNTSLKNTGNVESNNERDIEENISKNVKRNTKIKPKWKLSINKLSEFIIIRN